MSKMWIVAKEVYRKNVKSWSFFWMVMSPILMIVLVLGIGYLINRDIVSSSAGDIAIIGADNAIETQIDDLETANNINYDMTIEDARSALSVDEIEGYLVIDPENYNNSKYYRKSNSQDIDITPFELVLGISELNEVASRLNLSETDVAQIQNTSVSVEQINLTLDDDGNVSESGTDALVREIRTALAYGVSIIIFIFVMNYVGIISQEIAAEKGSRIMEIILSSISATEHFIGKLVGIFLVIVTQVVAYAILFILFQILNSQFNLIAGLEGIDIGYYAGQAGSVLYISLIFALLGILIYTVLGGFLGSLVSRTEDVSKVILPVTFTGLIGFYIGMYALVMPNSAIVRITSHIPLFTPFIMPFRLSSENIGNIELIISIVISLLFTVLVVWFSLIFYRSNVLVYSDKGTINTMKRSFALWKSERATN